MLKEKYIRWGDLNELLGWDRTNARLSQIFSGTIRSGRGVPYVMGDETAREIETKLGLEVGWMDTPPAQSEIYGDSDQRTKVMQMMEAMPPDQWPTVVRLVDALSQPPLKTGTSGPG